MLVVLLKSIITFFLVWYIVRLMGKRQLGEMQPFELVITLIIAEVACIPMNDPYIPFYAGVVPDSHARIFAGSHFHDCPQKPVRPQGN